MEWFKDFISEYVQDEDKVAEIEKKFAKEVFPINAVPKDQFNSTSTELKTAREQLEQINGTIEDLKKDAGSVEEYKNQIQQWEDKYKSLESEATQKVQRIEKQAKFKDLLSDSKVHKDAVELLTDKYLDQLELDEEGKFKNTDSILETIREKHAGLMLETTSESIDKGEGRDKKDTKSTADMTPEEYAEYFRKREESRKTL